MRDRRGEDGANGIYPGRFESRGILRLWRGAVNVKLIAGGWRNNGFWAGEGYGWRSGFLRCGGKCAAHSTSLRVEMTVFVRGKGDGQMQMQRQRQKREPMQWGDDGLLW